MKFQVKKSNVKRHRHHYNIKNSTTSDFKTVQPLFSRFLMPTSHVKGSVDQFVRMSPLVYPAFGDVNMHASSDFVPIEQVYPPFLAFMSQQYYTPATMNAAFSSDSSLSFIPQVLPCIANCHLARIIYGLSYVGQSGGSVSPFAYTRQFSKFLYSERDEFEEMSAGAKRTAFPEWYNNNLDAIAKYVKGDEIDENTFTSFESDYIDTAKAVYNGDISLDDAVTALDDIPSNLSFPEAYGMADYLYVQSRADSTWPSTTTVSVLTPKGQALRKVLIGLGYNPSVDDGSRVSLLPLLAFYKAYFDRFYPKRGIDWAQTYCCKLINALSTQPYGDISAGLQAYSETKDAPFFIPTDINPFGPDNTPAAAPYIRTLFNTFLIEELSECNVFLPTDYLSAQRTDINGINKDFSVTLPDNSGTYRLPEMPAISVDLSSSSDVSLGSADKSAVPAITGIPITQFSLTFMRKMTNYFAKDSLIGNRIKLWAKNHLDSDVYNSLYNTSQNLSSVSFPIHISDVDSSANTINVTEGTGSELNAQGSPLGAYAGKGVGNGKLSINFKANTYGYLFVSLWFTTDTSLWQGTDPSLSMFTKWDVPTSEFDALGYEVTPRNVAFFDNQISLGGSLYNRNSRSGVVNSSKNGFGFMPRYSKFKTSKDIVNGDLSRRNKYDDLGAMFINRFVRSRSWDNPNIGAGFASLGHEVSYNKIPIANVNWQQSYPDVWFGELERIFQNTNTGTAKGFNYPYGKPYFTDIDDNFIVHSVFDLTEYNTLLPLSQSYMTEVDSSDVDTSVTGS